MEAYVCMEVLSVEVVMAEGINDDEMSDDWWGMIAATMLNNDDGNLRPI